MKRNVVSESSLTPEQEKGYIALYEALVPENKLLEINVPMIYNEAFNAFENTIGVTNQELEIIKAHFGISTRRGRKVGSARISVMLKKLRTFENATHYIAGYNQLIENIASKIKGEPNKTPKIVKAKLLIMYFMFFCQSYFFPDEFMISLDGKPAINKWSVNQKRKAYILPEYMFVYMNLINKHKEKSMVYDMIVNELDMIDVKLQNEILNFVELKREGKKFISVNKACNDVSFENARRLKQLANPIPWAIETEKVADCNNIKLFRFQPMYEIYRLLKTRPLESFEKVTLERVCIENHNLVLKPVEAYEIVKDFEVSSQTEANRIIFMFEYAAKNGFTMKAKEEPQENKIQKDFDCVFGTYISVFEFSRREGYLTEESSLENEFKVANEIIERADQKIWLDYLNEKISHEELKSLLQIDKRFEEEVLGIKKLETPMETVIRFAKEAGYLEEEILPDEELIQKVFIENNEDNIAKLAKGEITPEIFKHKIGFEEMFAEMYFDIRKIDMLKIEAKLLELKKSRVGKATMKKSAVLIKLYCYIVQNNVKCGLKAKAPKGNKSLKPQNLLAMIEGA